MSSSFSETNRISLIWRHPLYQKHCEKIQELEKDRIFCRHTPEHFLDVARLMYIYSLENKLNLSREIIDRKSTRLNSSHDRQSRMPSSA